MYKALTRERIIDLIFVKILFSKNLISCKIAEDFHHGFDYRLILFKWVLENTNKLLNSRRLLEKIDTILLMEIFKKKR